MSLFAQKPKGPEGPQKGGGFFGGSPKNEEIPEKTDLNAELNSISRKLRLLEDRYSNLHKKTTVSEQNLISYNKRQNNEIKLINSELLDLRRIIDNLDSKLLIIIKELKLCAKKEEVDLLKRYVNLWEPIRFVTRKEVETIVKDVFEDRESGKIKK
jgi:hypothetical protein